MKIVLDRIDTRGLEIGQVGAAGDTVAIASTSNLRGAVVLDDDVTFVRDARADAIALKTLRLTLGSLVLSAPDGATLEHVTLGVEQKGEVLGLDITASSLEAPEVSILVEGVAVKGRALLEGARLVVRGDVGSLSAAKVDLRELELRIDDVDVRAEALRGSAVTIAWGEPAGFRLEAGSLDAPTLAVAIGAKTKLAAGGVGVIGVALRGDDVTVARATLEGAHVELDLSGPSTPETPPEDSAASEPLFDFRVLDGLSGNVDVDVAVDLTVPIIGRRNATHEFRVAIDQGTIDYRAFERDLSALEDAILDFSVRDGALVLERVNPLLPIRGHGKPIVAWSLTAGDLALAERDRVRLAVLPEAALVKDDAPSDGPPSESPVSLQLLRLVNLQARLSLAAPAGEIAGSVRPMRIGAFAIEGNIQYHPGTLALPGSLRAEIADLAANIHGLSIDDATKLDVEALAVGGVAPLQITFADVTPTAIAFDASKIVATTIAVKSRGTSLD